MPGWLESLDTEQCDPQEECDRCGRRVAKRYHVGLRGGVRVWKLCPLCYHWQRRAYGGGE